MTLIAAAVFLALVGWVDWAGGVGDVWRNWRYSGNSPANEDLTLSGREWWCGGCGVLNDCDHNAALNLGKLPSLSFPVSGRGDRVRPAMPAMVCEASRVSGLGAQAPTKLEYQISLDSE